MPELPDITIYVEALARRVLGQPLEQVRIASPFLLRTAVPPIQSVHGLRVITLRRLGKRIAFGFEDELWLVFHLMIAGRLHWREPVARLPGKSALAAFDFANGTMLLTEAGTRKRASLHVVQGEDALLEHNPGGLEVLNCKLDSFAQALTARNHTLKRALTDPRLFSGVGNAYSDEILHRARLSPVALTQKLSREEIERLHRATQETLHLWIELLRKETRDDFPEGVTAFRPEMAVHGKFGRPCPVCGGKVQRIRYASNETNYCPGCQTGGKLLADRSLSLLLKKDWPKTPEELDELRASKPDGKRRLSEASPRLAGIYTRPAFAGISLPQNPDWCSIRLPMKSNLVHFLCLAVCLAGNITMVVASAPQPPDSFDLKAIDTYLADYLRAKNLPGLSIAIVKNGELVFAKGYGKRSLEDGRPVEADTLFAIGSVTKQFTCACVLMLAEEGKLSVHDKVAKFFPDLTRANDITLLDLMNNVSGYADYYPLDFVDRRMKQEIPADDLLRRYAGGKLDFEPGSRYSYSNTGFILLGRVVEKASGEPFAEFLTRRILKPLGMSHTAYEPEISDKRLARGYTIFALSDPEYSSPEARGWIGAAGGIYSTPSDMSLWDLALMGGKVLKPESYELMTKPRKLNDGKLTEYGCGLGVRMQGSRQILAHNGAVSGFATWSAMIPSTKSALVMNCNQDGGLGSLPNQIFSLLLKEPVPNVPKINGPTAAEAAKKSFSDLQKGRVNRNEFSEEFNLYLTDEKIAGAARRLKSHGTVRNAEVLSSNERGGMEVTTARLTFKKGTLRTLMYRMPDGKIEQFFVYPE